MQIARFVVAMGNWKKILSFFFLATLIFIKVSSLHFVTHQGEKENRIEKCMICALAMDMQKVDFFQADTVVFEPEIILVWFEQSFDINEQTFDSDKSVYSYFSRPPPSMLS
ncbi:hypothetical protein J8L85_12280 [Maribacter sp. MMG018]|uniref:hypothetical protein n=1 Tax=Maribacter sp. MMG018 TaxID=2822688 RepID=UPI001B36083F|nr:hypothetical protein [Maribacter sp. MMG018]MBQ4915222.1 hypothetical protein [Maribacter sp. MMG018]